jgi:tetratricopeptide (TPR) repeat protein
MTSPSDGPGRVARGSAGERFVGPLQAARGGAVDLRPLRRELEEARHQYALGQYLGVREKLQEVVLALERSVRAHNALAPDGDAELALLYASALVNYGRVRNLLGNKADAHKALDLAAWIFEDKLGDDAEAGLLSDYGVALHMLERPDEAAATLTRAVGRGVENPEAYRHLAGILREKHELAGAERALRRALELGGDDPMTQVMLAEVLEARGSTAEAMPLYKNAAFTTAVHSPSEHAVAMLERAHALDPEDASMLFALGEVQRMLEQYEPALEALDAALRRVDPSLRPSILSSKAAALHGLARFDEALSVIDEALSDLPENGFALGVKGEALRALGRAKDAVPVLEAAARQDRTLIFVHLGLADALRDLGQFGEALKAVERGRETAPDSPALLAAKGHLLLDLGRDEAAGEALRRTLELDATRAFDRARYAEALRRLGRYEEALEQIEEAAPLLPRDAWVDGTHGQILAALGRDEAAVWFFRRARELAADAETKAWVSIELADAERRCGLLDAALAESEVAADRVEDVPATTRAFVLRKRAGILNAAGLAAEAEPVLREVAGLLPHDHEVSRDLAGTLRALGRPYEAIEVLEPILDAAPPGTPDQAAALAQMAAAEREAGKTEDALESVDEALEVTPESALALAIKGQALRDLGTDRATYAKAVDVLRRSLEFDDSHGWVWGELGDSLRILGRLKEALAALDRAVELEPETWWLRATRGQVLRGLDEFEDAARDLQLAVDNDPSLAWAQAELGESLRMLEDYDGALEALDAVLAQTPNDPWSLASKGAVLHALERDEDALEELVKARELAPNDVFAVLVTTNVLVAAGAFEKAIALLEGLKPPRKAGQTWLLSNLGWSLLYVGRWNESRDAYERAAKLLKAEAWCVKGVADALRASGRRKEATAVYARASALVREHMLEDDEPEALRVLAWCAFATRKYDDALKLYTEALSFGSADPSVQFDFALALAAAGRTAMAMSEYGRAIDLAENEGPFRRRGILRVALVDLEDELRLDRRLKTVGEVGEIRTKLGRAFAEVDAMTEPVLAKVALPGPRFRGGSGRRSQSSSPS